MRTHERESQFGWPEDRGLGLRLIANIKSGVKTATCCPEALLTPDEIHEMRASVGHLHTVVDHMGNPHCNIRVLEVFTTPWGKPDPRLVRGEGFASAAAWRAALAPVWAEVLRERRATLTKASVLWVELFELAPEE